jgi:hypothetical protein
MKFSPPSEGLCWHRVLITASDVAKLGAGGLISGSAPGTSLTHALAEVLSVIGESKNLYPNAKMPEQIICGFGRPCPKQLKRAQRVF